MKNIFIKFARFATESNAVFFWGKNCGWYKPQFMNFIINVAHAKNIIASILASSQVKREFVMRFISRLYINFFSVPLNIIWVLFMKSSIDSYRTTKYFYSFFFRQHSLVNIGLSKGIGRFINPTTLIFFELVNKMISFFVSCLSFIKNISVFYSLPLRITLLTKSVTCVWNRLCSAFKALFMFGRPHNFTISLTGQ